MQYNASPVFQGIAGMGNSIAGSIMALADRQAQERKEAEKEAKAEAKRFDHSFNFGKAMGLWGDEAKGRSTEELVAGIEAAFEQKKMQKEERAAAEQEQMMELRAVQLENERRRGAMESEEEAAMSALRQGLKERSAPRWEDMAEVSAALGQNMGEFDPMGIVRAAEGMGRAARPALTAEDLAMLGARTGAMGTRRYNDLAQSILALEQIRGREDSFTPAGGVMEMDLGGEVVRLPYGMTSKGGVQYFPEFAPGNQKYNKKQTISELAKLRIGVMKDELAAINRGLTQNSMLSDAEKAEWKARKAELQEAIKSFDPGTEEPAKREPGKGEGEAEKLLAEANRAITNGADPEKVKARLKEMGIVVK